MGNNRKKEAAESAVVKVIIPSQKMLLRTPLAKNQPAGRRTGTTWSRRNGILLQFYTGKAHFVG
jgi:hypothetical protein